MCKMALFLVIFFVEAPFAGDQREGYSEAQNVQDRSQGGDRRLGIGEGNPTLPKATLEIRS